MEKAQGLFFERLFFEMEKGPIGMEERTVESASSFLDREGESLLNRSEALKVKVNPLR